MSKLQQLKERALQKPEVRKEYDSLAEEFEMIDKLLQMRSAAGLTHAAHAAWNALARLELMLREQDEQVG